MKEKLQKLYNTMLLIETKGNSTKIMGECLRFTEELIHEVYSNENKANAPKEAVQEV